MSKSRPTFSPQQHTINDLMKRGWNIVSARQWGRWALLSVEGEFLDTPNERGDHIAISPMTIKIKAGRQ